MKATVLVCLLLGLILAPPPSVLAEVDFPTQVMPILTRVGCNRAACHGAATGRGGFRLSLWGANPQADYEAIALALEERRIDREDAEQSLILRKPMGELEHGGGTLLDRHDPATQRIVAWIAEGARPGGERRITAFSVGEAVRTLEIGASSELRAEVIWNDGQREDVTDDVLWTVNDSSSLRLDGQRSVTALRYGQQGIIGRYLDRVVPLQFNICWPASFAEPNDVGWTQERLQQPLDLLIARLWQTLRIRPTPICDDVTFIRRTALDLVGRMPSPSELERWSTDRRSDMRARWVDYLLATPSWVDYWTLLETQWLSLHGLPNEPEAAEAYAAWIRAGVAEGRSWPETARQIVLARGDSHRVGPANFGRMVADAREHAELFGRVFLGARWGCANCHNHPLDRWTQDDYHGMAAVFAQSTRGRYVVADRQGTVTNLRTGQAARPRIPGAMDLAPDEDVEVQLAHWLAHDGEEELARAFVNRHWARLMGIGLVEPIDDLRMTSPASHPDLWNWLVRETRLHGFDLRHLLRSIVLSSAYQRASLPTGGGAAEMRFYTQYVRRPLPPHVLLDVLVDVTDVPQVYPNHRPGTRAVHVFDPVSPSPPLDALGRCSGVGTCISSRDVAQGLATQLHKLNGELINQRVSDPQGWIMRRWHAGGTIEQRIGDWYVRCLCRSPSDAEVAFWREQLESPGMSDAERLARWQDLTWSMLNCHEFVENH